MTTRKITSLIKHWISQLRQLDKSRSRCFIQSEVLNRGAGEISTAFGLNRSFADILTGIILFFIIGCEFFINYKVQFRTSGKKEA